MPFYNWWMKLFKKEKERKKDVLKDIEAVIDFIEDSRADTQALLAELKKLKELEQEYHVARANIIPVNLKTQEKILDKIIERYEFFQNDTDVNGLRVKMIAEEFLKRAEKAGLKDILAEKKKSDKWKFQW
ncbi:MAG: hypothetical protein AB1668_04375 [Nanoarchaeota archaeon]